MVGVHLQDAADALLLVLVRVVDIGAGLELARVDPEVRELAHERVGHDLESDSRERLVVVWRCLSDRLAAARIDALHRRDIQRRRQVVGHRVQEHLHALVLEGRAAEHRGQFDVESGLPDGGLDALLGDGLALEIVDHELVVALGREPRAGECAQPGPAPSCLRGWRSLPTRRPCRRRTHRPPCAPSRRCPGTCPHYRWVAGAPADERAADRSWSARRA